MKCNLCGSNDISNLGTVGVKPVSLTSDMRFSQTAAEVFMCCGCGHLQKMGSCEAVYSDYITHHLSGGKEQMVFPDGKEPRTRSYDALERIKGNLPKRGKLLDVGTGNGAFLKSAVALLDGWDYFAFDLDDSKKRQVMDRVSIKGYYTASFENINDQDFDLIVLWHVLEHMREPVKELKKLFGLLAEKGAMLIQTPDISRNPFDLAIIDHCSHFTHDALVAFLKELGFCAICDGYDWIYNCLSFLLRKGDNEGTEMREVRDSENTANRFYWLNKTIEKIRASVCSDNFSIFGTGTASVWCYFQLEEKALFFIDEDRFRTGNDLGGVKIVHPSNMSDLAVEKGHKVIMPFMEEMSKKIIKKMRKSYMIFNDLEFISC